MKISLHQNITDQKNNLKNRNFRKASTDKTRRFFKSQKFDQDL